MKTDLYTKTILTIIAACLSIIVLRDSFLPKAFASNTNTVNQKLAMVPVNPDGSINVKLSTSDVMRVEIEKVDSYAFNNCLLPVKIKEADSYAFNNVMLPVKIKEVDNYAFNYVTIPVKMK